MNTPIGTIHGIQFSFDEGLLASINIEKHRKPAYAASESFSGAAAVRAAPLDKPHPTAPPQQGPVEAGADFVPDNSTFLQTTQELGVGRRQITVHQYRLSEETEGSARQSPGLASASLTFLFELDQPAAWHLVLPDVKETAAAPEPKRLKLETRNNTSVEIDSTEEVGHALEAFGARRTARISVSLPRGVSRVHLKVSSLPVFDFGETVVVCRPGQLREAAVVASCLTSERFPPVVVWETPPVTARDFVASYLEFQTVLRESMSKIGGDLGRAEVTDGQPEEMLEVFRGIIERQQLQEGLTPYRSWHKHNAMLSGILADIGLKRAVFLFRPDAEEQRYFGSRLEAETEAEELAKEGGPEVSAIYRNDIALSLLPEDVQRVYLLPRGEEEDDAAAAGERHFYDELAGLSGLAWQVLGPTGQPPAQTFDVPEDDEALYLIGLYCALRERVPLRPTKSPGPSLEDACRLANEEVTSDEAVLCEYTGDASNLISVLYANYRGARMLVCTEPDLTEVERLLDAYRQQQEESAKALGYVLAHRGRIDDLDAMSPIEKSALVASVTGWAGEEAADELKRFGLLDALRRYVLGDWQTESIEGIEAAVSAQVPEYVLAGVGDRRLTAFTTGLPYSFVNRGDFDWSKKAIGHIVTDDALIILSEVYVKSSARAPITFNMVFDPGFFQTSETDYVLQTLEQHFTHTVVLTREGASTEALLMLPSTLPVEVIFFNTHGSDNAIMLGDVPLQNHKIAQWVTLKGKPLVFNNSCLSWVGVGREFIRVGARGYVGTLWSVNSRSAAEFARVVMRRLTHEGLPVSAAVRDTGIDEATERSYIFVGSANSRLDRLTNPGATFKDEREYFLGALEMLLGSVAQLVSRRGINRISIARLLYEHARGFMRRLEEVAAPDSLDMIDVLIEEMTALERGHGQLGQDREYERALIERSLAMVERLPVGEKTKRERRAAVRHLAGRLVWRQGDLRRAVEYLEQGIEDAGPEDMYAAQLLFDLVKIHKQTGQWQAARETALKVKDLAERKKNDYAGVAALGELGQISKRLQDFDDAIRYAEEGHEKSVKIGDRGEQLSFKADLAQSYLGMGEYDKALRVGLEAVDFARSNLDETGELKCHGIVGVCYIQLGEFDKAEQHALAGLEQARKLRIPEEEGSFLRDLAKIKSARGDDDDAIQFFDQAASLFADLGNVELLIMTLTELTETSARAGNWPALFRALTMQVLLSINLHERLQGHIVGSVIRSVKEALSKADREETEPLLVTLWQVTAAHLAEKGEGTSRSPYLVLLHNTLLALLMWMNGRAAEATAEAGRIDAATGNSFGLSALVATPYAAAPPKEHGMKDKAKNILNKLWGQSD